MRAAILLLASAPFAAAVCPNSCSGAGSCGEHDTCTCYANFRGSDCSQRICPYAPAWVTTAKGDLNFDGDVVDYTVYNPDSKMGMGASNLITQEFVGGDWESWPAYGQNKEGHFYMECANRGLCDRETGTCACFAGYEGSACQRMVCPNDCSGKGTCQSTSYLTKYPDTVTNAWYNSAVSTDTYAMWDGSMAMACKCDPGYFGPDCSVRMCPVGDDMLTQTNQVYETQFVDIYTLCETSDTATTETNCVAGAANDLGGTVKLTFTDHFGEQYTTEPIDGLAIYNGAAANTFANNAQAALRALPNNVFSQTATVHQTWCETLEANGGEINGVTAVTIGGDGTAAAATKSFRVVGPSTCTALLGNTVFDKAGKVMVLGDTKGSANTALSAKGNDNAAACTEMDVAVLAYPNCVRLVVNFDDMAGDYPNLDVDVSEATLDGKTNAQSAADLITKNVRSRLPITTGTAQMGYNAPKTITVASGADDSYITTDGSGVTTVTMAASTFVNDATDTFMPGSKISIYCGVTNGVGTRYLGDYTVSSSTTAVLTLVETVPASTLHSDCGTSSANAKVLLKMVSHIIRTGADTDNADKGATADTSLNLGDIIQNLVGSNAIDYRIGFQKTDGKKYEFESHYQSSSVSAPDSGTTASVSGIVILESETAVSIGKNNHATGGNAVDSGTVLGSSTATLANAIADSFTDAVGTFYIEGDGTHENAECGGRGLCDTEAGECKCFAGYVGLACEQQNSLAA